MVISSRLMGVMLGLGVMVVVDYMIVFCVLIEG